MSSSRAFWILYVVFLLVIVITYYDWGISWDEEFYLQSGLFYAEHFFDTSQILKTVPRSHLLTHGALLDAFYVFPIKVISRTDSFELLHLTKALIASLTLVFVWWLGTLISSQSVGLVAAVLLATFPRWFGDIFDNYMDVSSALLLSIELIIGVKLLQRLQNKILIVIFGITSAISFSHRISLGIVPVVLMVILGVRAIQTNKIRQYIEFIVLGIGVWYAALFVIDPVVRAAGPVGIASKIIASLGHNSDYGPILFEGKTMMIKSIPWYYLSKWIAITTPPATLLFFLVGVISIRKISWIFIFLTFIIPILFVSIFKSAIWDGWRHFLFLSIPMVILAALGFYTLYLRLGNRFRTILVIFLLLTSSWTIYSMMSLHPYEYVYFNSLTGGLRGASGRFQIDYAVKTNKEAVSWYRETIAKDENRTYRLRVCGNPRSASYYFNSQIVLVGEAEIADAIICSGLDSNNPDIVYRVMREGVFLNVVKVH